MIFMSRVFDDVYYSTLHEEDFTSHYDDYIHMSEEIERFDFDSIDDYKEDHRGIRRKVMPGFSDYEITEDGRIFSYKSGKAKEIQTWPNQYGHRYTRIVNDDGNLENVSVHRLVAMTFIRNHKNDPIVMHLDDNPRNNNIYNLRWGTYLDNTRDCINKGRNYTKKVYCYDTDTIYNSCADAADDIGATRSIITSCCRNEVHAVKGMIFCYLEDKGKMSNAELAIRRAMSRGTRPIRARNVITGETLIFESRVAASKELNIPGCGISSCVNGYLPHTHGWEFENIDIGDYYD